MLTELMGSTAAPTTVQKPARAGTDPASHQHPSAHSRAFTGVFLIALATALYFGKIVFLPLVFALLLSFLLRPLVRLLSGAGIPRSLAALLILLAILGGQSWLGTRLAGPAADWMVRLPQQIDKFADRFRGLESPVKQMTDAAKQVEILTRSTDDSRPLQQVELKGSSWSTALWSGTRDFATSAAVVLITLYFLLANGDAFLQRFVALIPGIQDDMPIHDVVMGSRPQKGSDQILYELESRISGYLLTVTLINSVLGLLVAVLAWFCALPNPILWGFFAGIINFLPYIGPLLGILVIGVVSFDTHADDTALMLAAPLGYLVMVVVEGNVITPCILGRKLSMSPLAIFIWLVFMDGLWGIAGALLAVPILAVMKIFFDRIKPLQRIGMLIEP